MGKTKAKGRRLAATATAVAVAALTVAACGSSGSSGGSTSTSSGAASSGGSSTSSSSGGSGGVAAAQKIVKQAMAMPKFTPPGPSFDAVKAKGKTILSIPVSSQIQFEVTAEQAAQQVASKLGIKWIDCENQGQPSQWVQCMNRAVSQKVDLIDLFGGTNPAQLAPQLAAAKKAGIPVVGSHYYPLGAKTPPNVTTTVPTDFGGAGRLDAAWAIANGGPTGTTIVIRSSNLGIPETTGFAAIMKEFKTDCPKCAVKVVNVASTDWASKITPGVQSALQQNPSTKSILPMYDSMTTYVTPALAATGKTNSVGIATYNGDPPFMKIIQDGGPVKMEVGEALNWLAYGMLDQEMRVMLHLKPLANEKLPLRVFEKSNINQAGTPPTLTAGYGNSYQAGYDKLWHVKG